MSGSNIKLLENYINYLSAKSKVINKNIANIGTDNYKREEVEFKNILNNNISSMLKTTNEKHINDAQPNSANYEIVEDKSKNMPSGKNNVDIDTEMMNLAENTIRFKFASKKIAMHYKELQKIIHGGR